MCTLCVRLAVEICAICKRSLSILSKEKAFLDPLKCVQKNMGDNEGLAPLSLSVLQAISGSGSSLHLHSKK